MQPTQLGPYKIRSRLGRGGMGAVYEAEDTGSGRLVAVKTLAAHLGDDAGLRRRFAAEIETLKALRHPGIVQLLACGEEDGVPYFAMELVAGKSLEQVLRSGRLFTWRETVALALEIVRALKSAHDHGVVHRDLKPANLLLLDTPVDGTTVKLADFGIARLFGDASQTIAGTVVGTAEYMAPEQAAGKAVDQRADLYALGLVMFAMLTGRPPFHGPDVTRVLERQRRESPPRVALMVPGVPPDLDQLIDRLLAKDPAQRPANALAVGRLLAAIDALPDRTAGDAPTGAAERPTADHRASRPPLPETLAHDAAAIIDHRGTTRAMPHAETAVLPIPANGPDAATRHTAGPRASEFAHAQTVPAETAPAPAAAARNRFTTVEELHRATRQRAAADRRRQLIWQTLAAAVTAAAILGGGYLVLRPRTADELYGRIAAIAADETSDLRDARSLIAEFLRRYPADDRAAAVREIDHRLDVDMLERKARRRPRTDRPLPPIERDYRAAMAREAESPAACVAALEAIRAVATADGGTAAAARDDGGTSTALWLALVGRQIDRLAPLAARERAEDATRAQAVLAEAAALATAADTAATAERAALADRRRTLLKSLVELNAARPHMAPLVAEARRLLGEQPPDPDPQPRPEPHP
jgi:serine/threonine-protein kinase